VSDKTNLLSKLNQFGTWLYKFKLTDNISTKLHLDFLEDVTNTKSQMVFPELDSIFKDNWNSITCLDLGCNEGYFGFEVLRRGSKHVIGIDARQSNIDKANFIKDYFDYKNIQFYVDNVYNIDSEKYGKFDLTLCLGLIYHLDNPILALQKIKEITKQVCVIDTQVIRSDPESNNPTTVQTYNGSKYNNLATNAIFALIDEPDADKNECASITGLSCFPNKAAVFKMLKHVGFSDVIQLQPPNQAYEQYTTFDRIILLAKV